jgi:hypothetical protein
MPWVDAQLVLIAVLPILNLESLPQINADAQLTLMKPLMAVPWVDAQLVLMAVLAMMDPIALLNADAQLTLMPLLEAIIPWMDAQLVLMAVLLSMVEAIALLTADAQPTPTETAAHAQLVIMAVIRTVLQMFKQLPNVDVLRATTLRMVRLERHVQSVRSIRTK